MAQLPLWLVFIGFATRAVLVLLVLLSIWSVTVIIERRRAFRIAQAKAASRGEANPEFVQAKALALQGDATALRAWGEKSSTLLARSAREMAAAPQEPDAIAYAVKGFLTEERARLSRGLPVLASLGSNAPFIGLFGTVLGIIQSFGALATSASAMNSVIFSLAEALIATAVGLFVALPASLSYNYFVQKLRGLTGECEALRDAYLSRKAG